MNNQDYEKIKFESWIEFCKEHPIENPSMSIGEAFDFAFDRAYALGKQEKDADGEEMLSTPKTLAFKMYDIANGLYSENGNEWFHGYKKAMVDLFGNIFPPVEITKESKEPEPAGPSSQNSLENCDNGNHISTDDNKSFKVGDVVRIKTNASEYHQGYQNGYCWLPERDMYVGKLTTITNIRVSGSIELKISGEGTTWEAIDLEPYTEPKETILQPFCQRLESAASTEPKENIAEIRNLSKDCDKQFDNIFKDSFSKERRLNIAAMVIASIMGSNDWSDYRGATDEDVWRNMAKASLGVADALLAECEKGGRYDAGTVR